MSVNVTNKIRLGERIDRAVAAIVGDLCLLVHLYTARALVWLTLRQRGKGWAKSHAARRRQFKPAPGVWGLDKNG